MSQLQRLVTRNAPGTYVSEDTYGATPALLADHGSAYVLFTCTSASFPYNEPVYVSNFADYKARTISSPSDAAVELFFNQRSGSGLNLIRVPSKQDVVLAVNNVAAGTQLKLTVGGVEVAYTTVAGDTATTAIDKLGALVAEEFKGLVSYYRPNPARALVRVDRGVTVTATNLTATLEAASAQPRLMDVIDSMKLAILPELPQGYLCAPEFYQAFTSQVDRTALQNEMEALAADPNFYWVSVADTGEDTATAQFVVNAAKKERATFISTRGNSWLTFPYLVDLQDRKVPPSLAQVGVALRRARTDGFVQPPAGVNFPIYGVKGVTANITADMQEQLNPLGINCIRRLPGRGLVVYGARTLSVSPYYRFGATRVVLNVLAGTLRRSFDAAIFTLVDGQGVLFSRVKQTADNICEQLRLAGGLFGATPEEAYLNVCDLTNNTLDGLETGTVNLDTIAKPSPTLEALNITLSRASLSTVLVEVQASGDSGETQDA